MTEPHKSQNQRPALTDTGGPRNQELSVWMADQALQAIVSASPVAIVTFDLQWIVKTWNPAAERIFGWQAKEVLGKRIPYIPAEKWEEARGFMQRNLSGECFAGVEVRRVRKDGSPIDITISTAPLRDGAGRIQGILAVSTDITERKKAEQALQQSEAQYESLFRQSPTPIWALNFSEVKEELERLRAAGVKDFQSYLQDDLQRVKKLVTLIHVWDVNHAALDFHQAKNKQQLLSDITDILLDETCKNFALEFAAIADGKTMFEVETPVQTLTGESKYVMVKWAAVKGYESNLSRVLLSVIDITERKRAEEALRESESKAQFLSNLLEKSSQPFAVGYGDGRLQFFNQALCDLLGYTREELLSKSWKEDLTAADWRDVEKAAVAECVRTRKPQRYEKVYIRKNGSRIPVELLVHFWDELPEKMQQFYAFITDISDRKRIEAALTLQARVLETMVEGVCVITEDGLIKWTNPRFDELFGYQRGELLGQSNTMLNVYSTEETRRITEQIIKQLRTEKTWVGEFKNRRKDGTPFTTFARINSVESSGIRFAVSVQEDITEQKRTEEMLRKYAQNLQVLSRQLVETQETERRRIARELHDQVGQALTVVQMSLQAALRSRECTALTPQLSESLSAVDRVLQQVHDLSLDLRPSILDDLGLAAAVRWFTNRQAAHGQIRCEFRADTLEQRLDPIVETACFRVAQEALTNVLRHSKGNSVAVELRKSKDSIHLYVRDNGVGFDLPAARERAVRGASLGLLGMEERAALAGGQLECKSVSGHGTEVHAWFPLKWRETPDSERDVNP